MSTVPGAWLVKLALALLAASAAVAQPTDAGSDEEAAVVKRITERRFTIRRDEGARGRPIVEINAQGARDADLVGLKRLRSLRRLYLANSQVTDATLREVAGLEALELLHLMNSKVTAAGLKELRRLKKLQQLYLDDPLVTDAVLRTLRQAGTLHALFHARSTDGFWAATDAEVRQLALTRTPVTDVGLKELAGLKSLQVLYLNGATMTDAGLKELAGLTSLRTLSLPGARVTDAGLKEIAGCKSMQALYLGGTRITDASLKVIASLKSLHTLRIEGTGITDEGLRRLKGLPLHTLVWGDGGITDARLRLLRELNLLHALPLAQVSFNASRPSAPEQVYSLNLSGSRVTGAGLKELVGLRGLQWLNLERTGITTEDLKALTALPSVCMVQLPPGLVNDATLRLLRQINKLHVLAPTVGRSPDRVPELNLSDRPITDAGLKELAGLKSLETLRLGNTRVTDAGLKVLAALPALRVLHLENTQVTDAGLKTLARFPALAEVALNGTRVTDAGLKAFAGHKTLHTLGLDGKQISDTTLRTLREMDMLYLLPKAKTLSGQPARSSAEVGWLFLTGTQVTDAGLKELTGLKSLQVLYLRGSRGVTDRGIAELKKALPGLKNVRR